MTKLTWSAPPQRQFQHFCVNPQEPLRRTDPGFDYLDQEVELIIEPGGRHFRKDEAPLTAAVSRGRIAVEGEQILRAEGRRVLQQATSDWLPAKLTNWMPPDNWRAPNTGGVVR